MPTIWEELLQRGDTDNCRQKRNCRGNTENCRQKRKNKELKTEKMSPEELLQGGDTDDIGKKHKGQQNDPNNDLFILGNDTHLSFDDPCHSVMKAHL